MTTKQDKAIKILAESGGKKSVTKAMIEAGYSKGTTQHPSILTKSKAYQTIVVPKLKKAGVTLDNYINNVGEAMTANHKVKTVTKDETGTIEEIIDSGISDIHTRLAGNKQAEKLLKIDQLVGIGTDDNGLDPEDLTALAGASDEVQLTQILFKKHKG